jgi:hypothetical protein
MEVLYMSWSDKMLAGFISDVERILGTVYSEPAKTVDEMTEEELKAALERKVKEKQQKVSRIDQLSAKLKTILREDVVFTVNPSSTKDIAMVKFSTTSGTNGTLAVHLKNDNFFN